MSEIIEGLNDLVTLDRRWRDRTPVEFHDADLAGCDPRFAEWRDAARKQPGRGLLVIGPNRTGKTYAVMALARSMHMANVPTQVVKMVGLQRRIMDGDPAVQVDKLCETPAVLFLDDLGAEHDSDWMRSRIFEIVDARSERRLRLVITTNLVGDGLTDRYGPGLVGRLEERCDVITVVSRWWEQ